jgi:hypothetical protein
MEIAAGVARRDLPLFSCSYSVRMLRGICVSDVVLREIEHHQCLVLFFYAFCWKIEEEGGVVVTESVAVAAAAAAAAAESVDAD